MEYNGITFQVTRKKVKNINLRIRHDGSVSVSAPFHASDDEICKFVASKQSWIAAHGNKLEPEDNCFFYLGESVPLSTIHMPLQEYYMQQANLLLDSRFKELCTALSITPTPGLVIKPMRGKYGLYSKTDHAVHLNAGLIAVPQACIDYVIIHELVHTKYFNHGKGFHAAVARLVPQHKALRQLLSKYVIFNLFD